MEGQILGNRSLHNLKVVVQKFFEVLVRHGFGNIKNIKKIRFVMDEHPLFYYIIVLLDYHSLWSFPAVSIRLGNIHFDNFCKSAKLMLEQAYPLFFVWDCVTN